MNEKLKSAIAPALILNAFEDLSLRTLPEKKQRKELQKYLTLP